jgi:membrane associated rhomboid family serine protease
MYFGHRRFLAFYLLVGFAATLAHILFSGVLGICGTPFPFGHDMLVGASGAIAGVMGAFFILYPNVRLRVSLWIFPLVLPAYMYLLFWVGTDIYRLLTTTNSMIAHWAHIGGFFAGVILVFFATLFVPAPPANPLAHLDDE